MYVLLCSLYEHKIRTRHFLPHIILLQGPMQRCQSNGQKSGEGMKVES